MKILVTGGAGFIGSHVVDAYIHSGHDVLVIDDLSTGKLENIHPKARFHKLNICDPDLEKLFGRERPQVLNHHAAQASVRRSVEEPAFDAQVNILGTLNLLNYSFRYGVEKFILASTGGALYGEPDVLPVTEDHPIQSKSPYGLSKYAAEQYLRCYHEFHGLKHAILRYANVYGPRQDPFGEAGVVAIFAQALLEGVQPAIFGDGDQTRDFVYVEDVARANLLALGAENFTVNIGTGSETSVNVIYKHLAKLTGYPGRPRYEAPRPGEVCRISLDPGQAKKILGWEAQIKLEEGLQKTVASFQTMRP